MEIKIKESEKINKYISKYSAFVQCGYDELVIEYLRKLPLRAYNKATCSWEIPISDIADLCNTFQDKDITITGTYHTLEKKIIPTIPKDYHFKTKPFKHQIEGVEFGLKAKRFILADDCGLGKTKQIIDLCGCLGNKINKVLIVCCVNSLKYNWLEEIHTHSDYSAFVLGNRYKKNGKMYDGGTKARLEDLENMPDCKFIITNIESLRGQSKKVNKKYVFPVADKISEMCKNGEISLIAVDEIHNCKNESALQTKALLRLSTPYEVAMTGTPILNIPLDIYIPLKWLGYETRSFYSFKHRYCVFGGWGNSEIIGYKNLDELKKNTLNVMLRRKKEEILDLPEKMHKIEYVDMSPKQEKIYEMVRLGLLEKADEICQHNNPLTLMIKLRQATGYTGILSDKIKESAKLDRMEEIVSELVKSNQKCIIFSEWTSITEIIKERLKQYNPAYITGEIENSERINQKNKFQNDDTCKVIIGTRGAMGTGLTLTAAQTVIFIDNPWNMALKQQAEDRAHRFGAKGTVTIIDIVCKNTIDERLLEIIKTKGLIAENMLDYKLSVSDIYYLLGA
uniref:Chromatin remodeling complex ATPase n=1 Tax=Siphoviridae sp. ctsxw88 TaxID=2825701 RepID=A0A8S5PHU0_9CAUD|nr:MAG TPA: Chromatin remodeling complex ATPase [Siphoviridae sp. ctsxw88]